MRKFEGNVNGTVYTDESEFNKAILSLDDMDDVYISYRYKTISDVDSETESKYCDKNYVDENQYVNKIITNEYDVELDEELINRLKNASNKSEIKKIVSEKISDFDNRIKDNLSHIAELNLDHKILVEKIDVINNRIDILNGENNNYYLNKDYYTRINDLVDESDEVSEIKKDCECKKHNGGKCKCAKKNEEISLKDICDMTPYDLTKYLNKENIHTLSDLVEYFLKNC
jgi:hypothetical protein